MAKMPLNEEKNNACSMKKMYARSNVPARGRAKVLCQSVRKGEPDIKYRREIR